VFPVPNEKCKDAAAAAVLQKPFYRFLCGMDEKNKEE